MIFPKAAMRADLAVVVLGLAICACKRSPDSEPSSGPKAVQCAEVQVKSVKDTLEVRGTVAPLPDREAAVASQVTGRLLKVEVREGDEVAVGDVLAKVDDAPLADAARQADAALARAKAEHDNAETSLARIRHVFDRGIAARQEVDDAAAKEASAKATQVEAEAAARQAHRQIERAAVRSPLRGVVLKVLRKSGELVDGTPATAIVEVADISELELVADLPAQDLVRLSREAPAILTFTALPGREFHGSVSRVSSSVDRTTGVGTGRIRLLDKEPPRPPVGSFGVARVESGEPHQATLVPPAAVRNVAGGEGEVVVCGPDNVAHVRKVRPGSVRDGFVEIQGELGPADRVAIEPVLGLSDGDALEGKR
jgi:multidrug efflux system membrane fusion protein